MNRELNIPKIEGRVKNIAEAKEFLLQQIRLHFLEMKKWEDESEMTFAGSREVNYDQLLRSGGDIGVAVAASYLGDAGTAAEENVRSDDKPAPVVSNDSTDYGIRGALQYIGDSLNQTGREINSTINEWIYGDSSDESSSSSEKKENPDVVNNRTGEYVNQKDQIDPFGMESCGPASVSIITGVNPQKVADYIKNNPEYIKIAGKHKPRHVDLNLVSYLRDKKFTADMIVDGGTSDSNWTFTLSDKQIEKLKGELNKGNVVLYHFANYDKKVRGGKYAGHYAVMKGYDKKTDEFIFHDPAGDRKDKKYFSGNLKGQDVRYSADFLKKAGNKRLWSISEGKK